MSGQNYFFTWVAQEKALSFELLSASGVELQTKEFGRLIDLSSTSCHISFGHNNPQIIESISKQLQKLPVASPIARFSLKKEISKKITDLVNSGDARIFYTVSGAETVENALKMSRDISGRKIIAALSRSYHGATLGALSVTGDWRSKHHLSLEKYTLRLPNPQEDKDGSLLRQAIEAYGPQKISAFCLETISGSNGVHTGSDSWWKTVQRLCKEYKIHLILDEVVCGFYRTGRPLGIHHFNLSPDFVCLSKSISGGFIPFGALWVRDEIATNYDNKVFSYGLTNYAHPLGLAAARGVFDIISSSSFKSQLKENEKVITRTLSSLSKNKNVIATRHHGMLAAIELITPMPQIELFKNGLYLLSSGNNLILAPALTISKNQLEEGLAILIQLLENPKNA